MAVNVSYTAGIAATETLDGGTGATDVQSGQGNVVHNQWNQNIALTSVTTPATTKYASVAQALTAGAATVDLTALTGTNGAAVNANGLKLVAVRFQNPGSNPITVAKGASNGYTGLGASLSITIPAG